MIVEVRYGEGGDDAKAFACELAEVYARYGALIGLACEHLTEAEGHVILKFTGDGAAQAFEHEPGSHCVQRVPPTEARDRRQTSFVSVAVLPLPPQDSRDDLPEDEVEVKTQCGSGPGGQHQNKTASAVRMTHRPTGIQVFINGRDQHANKREARRLLTARVREHYRRQEDAAYQSYRKEQLGSGRRGHKVRTWNFIASRIIDHRLGTHTRKIREVMRGRLPLLFEGDKGE